MNGNYEENTEKLLPDYPFAFLLLFILFSLCLFLSLLWIKFVEIWRSDAVCAYFSIIIIIVNVFFVAIMIIIIIIIISRLICIYEIEKVCHLYAL